MADFTYSTDDAAKLGGITWAREAHNRDAAAMAAPPPTNPESGEPSGPPIYSPDMPLTPTDQDYMAWVMDRAAASYAQQKAIADLQPKPEPSEP